MKVNEFIFAESLPASGFVAQVARFYLDVCIPRKQSPEFG